MYQQGTASSSFKMLVVAGKDRLRPSQSKVIHPVDRADKLMLL